MDGKDFADEFKKGYEMTEKEWEDRQKPYQPWEEEDTSLLDKFGLRKKGKK